MNYLSNSEKILTPDTFDSVNVGGFRGSKPELQTN